eukprot:3783231-Rhodomonas_salina.1
MHASITFRCHGLLVSRVSARLSSDLSSDRARRWPHMLSCACSPLPLLPNPRSETACRLPDSPC